MKLLLLVCLHFMCNQIHAQTRCIREGYVVTPHQQKNMEIVNHLVKKYNPTVLAKYQLPIKLKYHLDSCDTFQLLGGHNGNNEIVVEVYSGALKKFDEYSIVTATCHELGHILGEISLSDAGLHGKVTSQNAVEGEADYFAGKCTYDYFEDMTTTLFAIRSTFETLYGKKIDESVAIPQSYSLGNGIHSSYPSPECRLLSAFLGSENLSRPTCWYNPK